MPLKVSIGTTATAEHFASGSGSYSALKAAVTNWTLGQAQVLGGSEYAMRVWVKPDQLAKLNLTVPDITRAIQEQNVIAPAGQIGPGPPARSVHRSRLPSRWPESTAPPRSLRGLRGLRYSR